MYMFVYIKILVVDSIRSCFYGEAADDQSGWSVSLNGTTAKYNDGNGGN